MKYYILFFITIASLLKGLAIVPLWFAEIAEVGYQGASLDAYNAFMDVITQWNTIRKELFNV